MPSLETTHPNCDAAIPGPPWNAPLRAWRGDPVGRPRFTHSRKRTTPPMTKPTNSTSRRGLSRRQLLKATGGTAALLAAAKLNFPAGAFAQGAGPEVKGAKLGFIALTDASPLFVAKEKGLFAKYGVPDTEVLKQASWGATR